ncbi:MAG: phosphate/phosphite/phosphonate ABC transporter substrate-binding protein [Candidatus Accumulibacter sp.]|jgi:phosphonate transport system substrate-binding protein|nr:phosphate/phosphite/phosphonate ABC transporter substrate-binding protein [Accumulibacter sp.]
MTKTLLALALLGASMTVAHAQQENCPNRGELDAMYCDADHDLVADPPTDPKKFRDPNTIIFAFTPVEDPSVYEKLFQPFMGHLSQCLGKKTIFFAVQSNSAEIEAMRSGRLHIAAFSTGPTNYAVNIAGAVPFAIRGTADVPEGVAVQLIVRKDGPYQNIADLKGKKVAHTSPSSNSGNLAPRALFPALGLTPDTDYQVIYSGKHDQSILGVKSGDYDAAPVASDVLQHMIERGVVGADDFRTLYTSEKFPTDAYAYAHDLDPKLADKIKKCFFDYRIPPEMAKGLGGDRFLPADYKRDWDIVRKVSIAAGQNLGRSGYEAEQKKDKK